MKFKFRRRVNMEALEVINAETRKAYNLAAEKYHELFHDELNEKEYDRTLLDRYAALFTPDSLICDAGCGPSGHIARYLGDKGLHVIGVDISDRCIELARKYNPDMSFQREDISSMTFADAAFDGILSYYSIVDTPRIYVGRIFAEFSRLLKPNGYLLVAVKAGTTEGYLDTLVGIQATIYFALFTEQELTNYFVHAGFALEFFDKRNPYDSEIRNERIFAIGRKRG